MTVAIALAGTVGIQGRAMKGNQMLIAILRRRGLARFGIAVAAASALTVALTGTPANAASRTAGVPKAFSTSLSAPVLANGTYRWQNANSGLCLGYAWNARGATRQWTCATDNTAYWDLVNTGGNTYELINENNGQCLTIPGSSTADGAAPFVYICGGGGAQYFTLVPATDTTDFPGAYQIENTNSGKCVDVGGEQTNVGAWVVQYDCIQRGDEMWRPI